MFSIVFEWLPVFTGKTGDIEAHRVFLYRHRRTRIWMYAVERRDAKAEAGVQFCLVVETGLYPLCH
ncbi:MAG: hypothetical protein L0Z73_10330 [Gammaproteobacteria bacterium]|nr:hypothetical protein [Gammaproteobacteria bacterium]